MAGFKARGPAGPGRCIAGPGGPPADHVSAPRRTDSSVGFESQMSTESALAVVLQVRRRPGEGRPTRKPLGGRARFSGLVGSLSESRSVVPSAHAPLARRRSQRSRRPSSPGRLGCYPQSLACGSRRPPIRRPQTRLRRTEFGSPPWPGRCRASPAPFDRPARGTPARTTARHDHMTRHVPSPWTP